MSADIKDTIALFLKKKPFVAYRLPGSPVVNFMELISPIEFHFAMLNNPPSHKGFVMYPFNGKEEKGWWFNTASEITFDTQDRTEISQIKNDLTLESIGFSEYSEQFQHMKSALEAGIVNKVILSREITCNENINEALPLIFTYLCAYLPNAFAYLISTPQTGTWIGASPEVLLKKADNICHTVALAGTRKTDETTIQEWSEKEQVEQNMVSDYIDLTLKRFNVTEFKKDGPHLAKAGNVAHLKTEYSFSASDTTDKLAQFIEHLHPTPALCGEPKEIALELISKTEKHKRSYYGGFLGPVDKNNMNLFVNIRCMKVHESHTSIYVGGGLTQSSELQSEWNETILKSQTLLSVINKLHTKPFIG
jgi:isochorismate synthase